MRFRFKMLAASAGLLVIGYPLGVALLEVKHTTDAVKQATQSLAGREQRATAEMEPVAPAASATPRLQAYQP